MQTSVHTVQVEDGIFVVTMRDEQYKNAFSKEMVAELNQAFEMVEGNESCRVVILTGYDSYFSTGGTKEALLALHEGTARFTDNNLYSLPLRCSVPVIAAMQGHGIGGGLILGLFADITILSRESVYTANFMRYGFTPGMGATLVMPLKLGLPLAEEMLLSGNSYRGAELELRGIPFAVHTRPEVLPAAMKLARQLAEKPRLSLVTLKDHLTRDLRNRLSGITEQEVEMHRRTFSQLEVKNKILSSFGN